MYIAVRYGRVKVASQFVVAVAHISLAVSVAVWEERVFVLLDNVA